MELLTFHYMLFKTFANSHIFRIFAICTTSVCVPFFILVGSLNSKRGLHFWKNKIQRAFSANQLLLRLDNGTR